ncbi:MAG: DNA repair protein RadA [Bacteroidales bacterium]|nr:DNA repair protein RadA [Bacteroidales bacterium]MDT8430656.1 DNA repair protein RadA [Bacteroidales bacterium]
MAKSKTVYVCQNCGTESAKWVGRCNSCGEWNTLAEQVIHKSPARRFESDPGRRSVPEKITEVRSDKMQRYDTRNNEFNRVLGGGLVPGSMVLIGGEPGIGKSTLALQIAIKFQASTLYVSGEESPQQIKMRAERLGSLNEATLVLAETSLQGIITQINQVQPELVIIDSIQTLFSEEIESTPGSVSQVRECAAQLLRVAKQTGIPVILIGHITKEGNLAGPKILEHIVDTVLQFEGDSHHMYRILRASKNRFGSTSELGVFEMRNDGLAEVANPSEVLLSQQSNDLSGSAVAANIEGIRPLMIETQALVSTAAYGTPQRTSNGFDVRRLNMLLAVLEKRANFHLSSKDVFINIAGGLRVDDPATDLAIVSAVLSSTVDIALDKKSCFAGEVGLSGEIRPVGRLEQRISEAEKLGFSTIFVSAFHDKAIQTDRFNIRIVKLAKVQELPKYLFG